MCVCVAQLRNEIDAVPRHTTPQLATLLATCHTDRQAGRQTGGQTDSRQKFCWQANKSKSKLSYHSKDTKEEPPAGEAARRAAAAATVGKKERRGWEGKCNQVKEIIYSLDYNFISGNTKESSLACRRQQSGRNIGRQWKLQQEQESRNRRAGAGERSRRAVAASVVGPE